MAKFTLRAVSRQEDGKVTNVADSWPLLALSIEEAKSEADKQKWFPNRELANVFEIVDEGGRTLTWRPFREGGEDAPWS